MAGDSPAKNCFRYVAIFLKTEGKKSLGAKYLIAQQASNRILPHYLKEK